MAHTTEQRDNLKVGLCGAKKKNGELCRAFKGQGTDHKGIGSCKNHGGATPSAKKHALTVQAKQRMVKLGAPIDGLQPKAALLGMLRATAGHFAWLHHEIGGMEDLENREAAVLIRMYDSERDRLTRIAKACSEVGVEEAVIRIHEQEAGLYSAAVEAAFVKLGLPDAKRREFHLAIAEALEQSDALMREAGTEGLFAGRA